VDVVVDGLIAGTGVLLIYVVLVCAYYYLLLFVALFRTPRGFAPSESKTRFVILIPAHDEEGTLPGALRSCAEIQYPPERYGVVVIADNCRDHTAQVARDAGVRCLERTDSERKGKGHALQWGLAKILQEEHDAVVVLDADCEIDPQALTAFDVRIQQGCVALQSNNTTSNSDASPIAYATAVGNFIENQLFYAPKSTLGLSVFLRGTGMVLSTAILRQLPWDAFGLAEDVEYTIRLLKTGNRVNFVPDATVRSPFPVDERQLGIQRTRWARGNLGFGRVLAPWWILSGLATRRLQLVDAGWTLMAISRPLAACAALVAFGIAEFGHLIQPRPAWRLVVVVGLGCLGSLVVYAGVGVVLLGLSRRRVRLLAGLPVVLGRLAWLSVLGFLRGPGASWSKTPRGRE
jgi:1,2-diacylglycerol 3-beta-glucosyltransferase